MGDRALGPRHSLMKTRYSRVKGAARSSLLKPLIVSEVCRRRCTATQPHSPDPEWLYGRENPRLRTTSWPAGLRRCAFNAWGSPFTLPRPAHPRRRTLPDAPPQAPPPGPSPARCLSHVAGARCLLEADSGLAAPLGLNAVLQRLVGRSPLIPLTLIVQSSSLSRKALISYLLPGKSFLLLFGFSRQGFS